MKNVYPRKEKKNQYPFPGYFRKYRKQKGDQEGPSRTLNRKVLSLKSQLGLHSMECCVQRAHLDVVGAYGEEQRIPHTAKVLTFKDIPGHPSA